MMRLATRSAVRQLMHRALPRQGALQWSRSQVRLIQTGGGPFDGNEKKGVLVLEDGTRLGGLSFGADKSIQGEVVFTTGMVGYPESLTDPSYRGQVLVLTYPLVGNYGVPSRTEVDDLGLLRNMESGKIQADGLIVQDYSHKYSHWNAKSSLGEWLQDEGVPALHGIDTRLLTKKIRDKGAMLGKIVMEGDQAGEDLPMLDPNDRNLVAEVSCKEVQTFGAGNPHKVLAVHCGLKENMVRMLVQRGAEVRVVPWNYEGLVDDYKHWADGLFLSNGPGDPQHPELKPLVDKLREIVTMPESSGHVKPIFGICLGNQLLSLAANAKTNKLPFGNRGQNQPVINKLTGEAFITPQNHGYATDASLLPDDWQELFVNANDGTNEGIMHKERPYFTAQFHPEAKGGPEDTDFLFDMFLDMVKGKAKNVSATATPKARPERIRPKKVLLLGSGGLSIGQAGEFDYSGAQAIKALKEEGAEVVLMNPNIASVQTNHPSRAKEGVEPVVQSKEGGPVDQAISTQADNVYFLPVTTDFIELVIKRERPEGIVISMGGQTALNCGIELEKKGILEKYGVQVLGTSIESVEASEDRDIFSDKLREIGEKLAPSEATTTVQGAVEAAERIGYPCMIRSAFALGGLGSGICTDEAHLRDMAAKAFSVSPQILVEKSLLGWKEVEYEVVRDRMDNCITVCNMENFDPLGVHTGDSIVVAPSQTLSNEEYHMLRRTAINVVRHLGIVGECNIQYALDPESLDYCIIEVNPRLSRSSALASKATGYPLAAVAAKLALGITLPEITNAVTLRTSACFEPSLDYIVTKMPRWDLAKFEGVSEKIGSAMKSVGEVMAVGRSFEESFQKALRMVDPGNPGFAPQGDWSDPAKLEDELHSPTDKRVAAIAWSLRNGMSVEELQDRTKIDPWFLHRLDRMHKLAMRIEGEDHSQAQGVDGTDSDGIVALGGLPVSLLEKAKQLGYSDAQIANMVSREGSKVDEITVRQARKERGIVPVIKQIDTLAAEYPAQTNYLYATYHGDENDVESSGEGVVVLGSGTYRIGSSVEFDWCSVSAIRTLRRLGKRTIVVNYNPETVSTDYDESDRLYFEELSQERVLDIYDHESPDGVIVSVGGQIPNNLALPLHQQGVNILGTSPLMIDSAEDRFKFSQLMDASGIEQPAWKELTTPSEAFEFANRVGYPVLVRPSYVLSGAAMSVAYDEDQLGRFLANAVSVSPEHPVVVTKFMDGALEIELDGVARDGEVIAHAVSEHVENAGVHSGDATLVLPPQTLSRYYVDRVRKIASRVAKALEITGPFNMQLLANGAEVSVIECNLRASRSFPFVSKTVGADFIEAATRAMVGASTADMDLPAITDRTKRPRGFVGIKAPMFSFTRLRGADPILGVEMASTGEVACFGADRHEAFLKSMLAAGFKLPKKAIFLSAQAMFHPELIHGAYKLADVGYELRATPGTAAFLKQHEVPVTEVPYPDSTEGAVVQESEMVRMIKDADVDLVVNLPNPYSEQPLHNYHIRRTAVDFNVPLLTNVKLFSMFADAIDKHTREPMVGLKPESLFTYYGQEKDEEAWTDPKEFH